MRPWWLCGLCLFLSDGIGRAITRGCVVKRCGALRGAACCCGVLKGRFRPFFAKAMADFDPIVFKQLLRVLFLLYLT